MCCLFQSFTLPLLISSQTHNSAFFKMSPSIHLDTALSLVKYAYINSPYKQLNFVILITWTVHISLSTHIQIIVYHFTFNNTMGLYRSHSLTAFPLSSCTYLSVSRYTAKWIPQWITLWVATAKSHSLTTFPLSM